MGLIVLKEPWTRQPPGPTRVDWSNSLTRGLRSFYGLEHGVTGTKIRASYGPDLEWYGYGTEPGFKPTISSGRKAVILDPTGTGSFQSMVAKAGDANGSGGPNSTNLTMFARVAAPATQIQNIFSSAANGVTWRLVADNKLSFFKTGVGGGGTSTSAIGTSVLTDVAVTYDGATVRFYKNGQPDGTASWAGTFDNVQAYWFGRDTTSEEFRSGFFEYGGVFNRVLSASEVAALSANPWQSFEP